MQSFSSDTREIQTGLSMRFEKIQIQSGRNQETAEIRTKELE